jgi:hypothetical protein
MKRPQNDLLFGGKSGNAIRELESHNMLTVATIFKFLAFDAEAIKKIASNPKATWVGFLFVISAGFAREYDGEYLVAEPWHLLIPVAASLIGCSLMVLIVHGLARLRKVQDASFLDAFRGFLNLYWMTAPLAWLYAIPVERMFDPGLATRANLILLGIVAVWRVALMVRCVQVLYRVHPVAAFIPVILFSDMLAMAALWLVPGPVFMIMGGVRLTESEAIILDVRIWMILIGYGTLLFWLIGYLTLCYRSAPWHYFKSEPGFDFSRQGVSRGLGALVAFSLLVWAPFLPFTQREQKLRWTSERLIRAEDFTAFSKLTQDHLQQDFPPHWDPPPRLGYGENRPWVFKVVSGLQKNDAATWIADRYAVKMQNDALRWRWEGRRLNEFTNEDLVELVEVISSLPNSGEIAVNLRFSIDQALGDEKVKLTESRRASLEKLIELGATTEEL